MRTLILSLFIFLPLEARAAQGNAKFECVPFHPPQEQGEERFYKVNLGEQSATIEVADLVSPYRNLAEGLELRYSNYSDTESSAGAAFTKDGRDQLVLSLMYFGSWWGGNLKVGDTDYDLRCKLL